MTIVKRLAYHLPLNLTWMQANLERQFLFVGVCGCARSTQGQEGLVANTVPKGRCHFCGQAIEMTPLHAYDEGRWLELRNEEGTLVTRALNSANPGTEIPPAIHPNE